MGLENTTVIDAVGTETATGTVVLTILDSWNWRDPDAHLRALQAKLNTYFNYVVSGKLLADYPRAGSLPVRLDILFRFAAPAQADELLQAAQEVAQGLGFNVTHQKIGDET
jgi:hypothetical protein